MDFRNILFPVDFSAHCDAAVPHVQGMASLFGSSITLLHVVECPPPYAFDMQPLPESYWRELRGRAVNSLEDISRLRFKGFDVTQLIRQGDVASEILKAAEESAATLVMMPTRGHGRFRAALLGSVAAKVLHDVHCPVWTSTHPENCEPTKGGIRSIMCAIGMGAETPSLIRAAAELGEKAGAKVRLAHAVPGEENPIQRSMDQEFLRFLTDSARASIGSLQRVCGTSFEVCMDNGKPSRVVAAAARHHNADLVIIGHGKLTRFAGQFLTHAYSIIRDSPCPVLSL